MTAVISLVEHMTLAVPSRGLQPSAVMIQQSDGHGTSASVVVVITVVDVVLVVKNSVVVVLVATVVDVTASVVLVITSLVVGISVVVVGSLQLLESTLKGESQMLKAGLKYVPSPQENRIGVGLESHT